ncbi:MAG TPA: alcohol dehydrogenase catalytic domain-containing protein [Blastocatellia bacterium]|nr:alcohol dehydrogenase catalytic domain-containing protein [Blastocatellia bacterium]
MRALRFDGSLRFVADAPAALREGEALVQVLRAGICNTDLEIVKGYAGFRGTLGHEFVGRVIESPDGRLAGRRVVGEINAGCGVCALCSAGDARHCAQRTVLGIHGRDGAFADYLSLPARNLIEVPDSISDEEAVFIEPLAAAAGILEQINIDESTRVAVIGDGKLAQLICRVLAQTGCALTVIGKHQEKLALLDNGRMRRLGLPVAGNDPAGAQRWLVEQGLAQDFDVTVEASGSATGLPMAIALTRPRGAIVLKSTHHGETAANLSAVVVNELRIVGSRCGKFMPALDLLARRAVDVRPLISQEYAIEEGLAAFRQAAAHSTMKVLLRFT